MKSSKVVVEVTVPGRSLLPRGTTVFWAASVTSLLAGSAHISPFRQKGPTRLTPFETDVLDLQDHVPRGVDEDADLELRRVGVLENQPRPVLALGIELDRVAGVGQVQRREDACTEIERRLAEVGRLGGPHAAQEHCLGKAATLFGIGPGEARLRAIAARGGQPAAGGDDGRGLRAAGERNPAGVERFRLDLDLEALFHAGQVIGPQQAAGDLRASAGQGCLGSCGVAGGGGKGANRLLNQE